eukprot:1593988-Pyramimonas_sp.AAC.1
MSETEAAEWMADFNQADPRALHTLVSQDPLIAARVFHWTVRLVMRTLFNCTDTPDNLHCDGIAANTLPGIFGHVRAYLGVVEEQMRKALHVHMLIQCNCLRHSRLPPPPLPRPPGSRLTHVSASGHPGTFR